MTHFFSCRMEAESSVDFLPLDDSPPMDDKVSIVAVDGSVPHQPSPSSRANPPPTGYGRARRSWRRSPSEMSTSYQPVDWASDDGVRFDGTRLRRTVSESVTSGSDFGSVADGSRNLEVSNLPPRTPKKWNPNFGNGNDPSTSRKVTTPMPTLLHGKNILQIMAIGSIEPIARDSKSVDWSDSLGVVDEAEDMSLMDPHYDLTSARMMKLFSLFNPAGWWERG